MRKQSAGCSLRLRKKKREKKDTNHWRSCLQTKDIYSYLIVDIVLLLVAVGILSRGALVIILGNRTARSIYFFTKTNISIYIYIYINKYWDWFCRNPSYIGVFLSSIASLNTWGWERILPVPTVVYFDRLLIAKLFPIVFCLLFNPEKNKIKELITWRSFNNTSQQPIHFFKKNWNDVRKKR